MIEVGFIESLETVKENKQGYLLQKQNQFIELPRQDVKGSIVVGDQIRVFVYTNKDGRMTATMNLPEATRKSYGWGTVADVLPKLGAFLHIGLKKDMLVSKDDLPYFEEVWPIRGDKLFVTLTMDRSGRLFAKPASEDVILKQSEKAAADKLDQPFEGYVYRTGKAGTFIWTTEYYRAFLHESEREKEPRLGERVSGRIIKIKEDGTINVSLMPRKLESMDADAEEILIHLTRQGGEIPFSDKSSPEQIKNTFHISKAAFKRAIGRLMKKDLIEQTSKGTIRFKN
ncbi:S1 RNA-binding domain-containing protein [Alteribacillus sp. HJP-4]|uniref:CvfB family protein n=1 Tax=Alteribacillus sp. HJP-4 TaxID=2775394 RepID=UPI0035CCF37D